MVALGLSTAQAGATAGTVPEVRLASDAAGALTISWDPPASAPSDYRVMWAEATQDYLSWKTDNETTRGNSYPEGTATSLTLTGLTEGAEYKVRVRSRYSSDPNGLWSGPWTDEATLQVSSTQAGATAGTVPEVRLASDAAGALTISWDPPASAPSDYRVMWAEATQDYLSWKTDNETTRGNSYPEGTATSLTLTGLTEGAEYKVRVRSRYSSGPNEPWSGPWTDEATLQVSSTQAADPALGKRGGSRVDARDEPLLDPPTLDSTPDLITSDDENLQFATQNAAQGLTSEVEAPVVATFVSNTSQLHANNFGISRNSPYATPFTTGSSPDGYQLTSVKVSLRQDGSVGLAVHANGAGNVPGAQVGDAFGSETYDHGSSAGEVTFSGSGVRLAPDTNYWLVLSNNSGSPVASLSNLGQGVDSGGLSGWSLGGRFYADFNPWEAGPTDAPLAVKLSGMLRGPEGVPEGVDFSADSTTVGRLEVGTLSTGFLSNRGDRDLFKLEDLPATVNTARDGQANKWSRKRYRVQAWFGDHAPGAEQGGEIFIMEAPSGSGSLYSAVSDTNEDGLSFFEFEAFPNIDYYVMVVPTAAIQRKSGSGYGFDTRTYTGAYKLQIVDVSNILEMVTTLDVVHPTGVTRPTVTTGSSAGLDYAAKFRTGWHGDGYVINRVEAAVSGADASAFAANAKVSIYNDSSGSPGTELFTLRTPADIWAGGFDDNEESFWAPSATTANNNLTRNTDYWVVFSLNTSATTGAYKLDTINTAGETAQQGWTLGAGKRKVRSMSTWERLGLSASIQIGVYASPNSTDHTHPVPLDTAPTGGS